jgi:hypothetical protein
VDRIIKALFIGAAGTSLQPTPRYDLGIDAIRGTSLQWYFGTSLPVPRASLFTIVTMDHLGTRLVEHIWRYLDRSQRPASVQCYTTVDQYLSKDNTLGVTDLGTSLPGFARLGTVTPRATQAGPPRY